MSPISVVDRLAAIDLADPHVDQARVEEILRSYDRWADATFIWQPDAMAAFRASWITGDGERSEMINMAATMQLIRSFILLHRRIVGVNIWPIEESLFRRDDDEQPTADLFGMVGLVPTLWAVTNEDERMAEAASCGLLMLMTADSYALDRTDSPRTLSLVAQPRILTNEAGEPDCVGGPAVIWHDPRGDAMYWRDGIRSNRLLVEAPDAIRLQDIRDENNVELRRMMVEAYGYDRYFRNSRAKLRQQDDYGKLWLVPSLRDVEDFLIVEVANATPEDDGTYRRYFLRVPPETRTSHEGVAWTFHRDADDYDVSVES